MALYQIYKVCIKHIISKNYATVHSKIVMHTKCIDFAQEKENLTILFNKIKDYIHSNIPTVFLILST